MSAYLFAMTKLLMNSLAWVKMNAHTPPTTRPRHIGLGRGRGGGIWFIFFCNNYRISPI